MHISKLYDTPTGTMTRGVFSRMHQHVNSWQTISIWPVCYLPPLSRMVSEDSLDVQSVQLLSHVQLFVTQRPAACQDSLSIINSWSPLKLMSIESVMPSNHLILCRPLLLLPPILPSIRVFSNELALHMRWPKYWSFGFNISPSNEHPGFIIRHYI